MSEIAEKTAEAVAENVEEAIDGVVEVVEVFRNKPVVVLTAGVVGVMVGAGGAWMLARKLLTKHYEAILVEEISNAREFYANLNKVTVDGAVLSPHDVMVERHGVEAAAEALRTYQGTPDGEGLPEGEPHDEIMDEEQIQRLERRVKEEKVETPFGEATVVTETTTEQQINVFTDDTFNLEEEMKYRTEDKPYIITHDEFYAAELDYDTNTLTFYEVDDTLTDEHDKPLEDVDALIGEDHLVRFGSGSKDKNIVFIRNDKLKTDYEIVRSKGSYLEEVLGMPAEEPNSLKHSDQRDRRRAFRHGDD